MNWCKFLWGNPWEGHLASGTSGSRRISLILPRRRARRRIRLCQLCTLLNIVTETAIVSFRTLPVGFPLPTISENSSFTLFCHLILDHGVSSIIFRFWPQSSCFVSLARYFFLPSSSICDNQVLLSSNESRYCAIPFQYGLEFLRLSYS